MRDVSEHNQKGPRHGSQREEALRQIADSLLHDVVYYRLDFALVFLVPVDLFPRYTQ